MLTNIKGKNTAQISFYQKVLSYIQTIFSSLTSSKIFFYFYSKTNSTSPSSIFIEQMTVRCWKFCPILTSLNHFLKLKFIVKLEKSSSLWSHWHQLVITSQLHAVILVLWNWPCLECLQQANWQTIHSGALFLFLEKSVIKHLPTHHWLHIHCFTPICVCAFLVFLVWWWNLARNEGTYIFATILAVKCTSLFSTFCLSWESK